jgi:hypothetical protein
MVVIWLLIGISVVTAAFFLPGNSVEAWPALNLAGIATLIYLLVLLLYTLRPPIPRKKIVISWILSLAVMVAIGFSWTGMERTTKWQRSQLSKIHTVIVRGIVLAEIPQLLGIVGQYHAQASGKKASLLELFKRKYPETALGANIYKPQSESDSLKVFVSAFSDNEITLIAHFPYAKGRDANYVSYTGRKGSVQEKFILTEKGVHHESEN